MTQKRRDFQTYQGLPLVLEYLPGDEREGVSPTTGKTWKRTMAAAYGYVKGSKGLDGDAVDVYLGDRPDSDTAYIIDQMRGPGFQAVDEQKVVLGCESPRAARQLYLKHYPDARFFGSIVGIPMDAFKEKVMDSKSHGKKLAAAAAHLKLAMATPSREDRIAAGVDNVGLGMLAAPSAAYLAGSLLKRFPKTQAAGTALQKRVDNYHGSGYHGLEMAGLGLVSPTVSHGIAKRVDKALPGQEKVAFKGLLAKAKGLLTKTPKVAPAPSNVGASVIAPKPTVGGASIAGQTAGAGASAGAPANAGRKTLFTGKNIVGTAAMGTVGLGLYGAKKVIDVGAELASPHETDWNMPSPYGLPRAF